MPDIKWKQLHSQSGMIYAEMAKEILEKHDIPCILKPGDMSWVHASGTSIVGAKPFLLVPEERYDECLKLIDETMDE